MNCISNKKKKLKTRKEPPKNKILGSIENTRAKARNRQFSVKPVMPSKNTAGINLMLKTKR